MSHVKLSLFGENDENIIVRKADLALVFMQDHPEDLKLLLEIVTGKHNNIF